ncbi:MAG TPA: PilZ domain-containing protein [Nitrospiria bacterium]
MSSPETSQPVEKQPKQADPRRDLRAPLIVLKVTEEGERNRLFGYAQNVSRGGLFIQSVNPRYPGDQFRIAFEIPETAISIQCRCEVVWRRTINRKSVLEPGYGIRFLDLDKKEAEKIDSWVKTKL